MLSSSAIAGLLLLAASASERVSAKSPQVAFKECLPEISATGREVACATLTLPADRSNASGRSVRLEIAMVKARNPRSELPPVIYLQGGPGAEVIRELPRLLTRSPVAELIGSQQDWIFFDARGVGLSTPSLDCPDAQLTDAGPASEEGVRKLVECVDKHIASGVDLSRYNTAEVARDVQDIRRALGLRKVDLFGVSGGTTVAATILRDLPHGIRAVVQDSPWPPEAPWTTDTPRAVADAVRLILAKCAAHPVCSAKYPKGTALVDQVAARWLKAAPTYNGRLYTVEDLGIFLMDAGYFTAATFPADLARIAAGDLAPIEASLGDRSYYYEAQHLAHVCKEEIPFERPRDLMKAAHGDAVASVLVPSLARLFDLCKKVRVGRPARAAQAPTQTSIPTLFLVAEVDPGNSPDLRRSVQKYSNAQLVVVTNATHVTIKTACGRELTKAFFRAPNEPLDRGCLELAGSPFPFDVK